MHRSGQRAHRDVKSTQGRRQRSAEIRRTQRFNDRRERRAAFDALASKQGMLILGILLALALASGSVYFVVHKASSRASVAISNPTELYTPQACADNAVQSSIETSSTTSGDPVTFTIKLTNTSESHPCWIDTGWGNLNVHVTSGSQTIADTKQCQVGTESRLLLLDRSMGTTVKVEWNGGVGTGCIPASENPADDGTYVAQLQFSDNAAPTATTSFVLK